MVKENDYIFATIGNTIGKVNLVTEDLKDSFISNNTSRFRLKNIEYPYYYELLLRSFIVQLQIQQEFTQTVQPKIGNKELGEIIVPKQTDKLKNEINEIMMESYEMKVKSEKLLEKSIKSVEIAIEKTEEEAIKYLEEEIKKLNIEI